jgi:formate hydrogenlyase subunit 6/NADH:ubiquinone oxidoreductase subunit I
MDACVLASRGAVDRLRRALAADRRVIEPRTVDGGPAWVATDGEGAFEWTAAAPLAGVKRWLFPPRETLLSWDAVGAMRAVEPRPASVAFVGLRACDLAAIAHLDAHFARDPWYRRRRDAAFLVGVDCVAACAGGFCLEVDAGPFARAPFDLNLTPLSDGRVVVAWGGRAGIEALHVAALGTTPVDDGTALLLAETEAEAAATFPVRPYVARALARVNAAPSAQAIADEEWQALGPRCLACTGCTSLCPTCTCFTVVDEADDRGGTRARIWDSCLLEGFQREASGHHPAPRPGDRVRRFWYHKLSRDFTDPAGRLGCVGCGRCDVACPGTIGALGVLAALGGER